VSQLRRCFKDPHRAVDHEMLELQDDLFYKEHPIRILDQAERRTRQKVIKFLKVLWSNHTKDEATWECEERLREEYPDLFPSASEFSGREFLLEEESCNTPLYQALCYVN
jgi:hypothetical protein